MSKPLESVGLKITGDRYTVHASAPKKKTFEDIMR